MHLNRILEGLLGNELDEIESKLVLGRNNSETYGIEKNSEISTCFINRWPGLKWILK